MWLKFYMLYLIPMDLQHESKLKRLRIVYLPLAIVVGFKNPDFQTLSPFFRWCFFFKIIKCSRRVRDHFSYLYNRGFHHTTLLLRPCMSSCWNMLLNSSGRGMVKDVVKVLDHIMNCWMTWWTCSANRNLSNWSFYTSFWAKLHQVTWEKCLMQGLHRVGAKMFVTWILSQILKSF